MNPKKNEPPDNVVERARLASLLSPCFSKRGVVLWDPHHNEIFHAGYNGPAQNFSCTHDAACRSACSRTAVHAEQRVLIESGRLARGMDMLHVKTVDGVVVTSGEPSCLQCSKILVEAGISGMWLLHEDGWRRYDANEFHRLTLEHCKDGAGHAS